MAKNSNIPFVHGLAKMLNGIGATLDSGAQFQTLLRELGWQSSIDENTMSGLDTVLAFRAPFQQIRQLLSEMEEENADTVAIATGIVDLSKDLFELIKNISNASLSSLGYPFDQPGFGQQLAEDLIPKFIDQHLAQQFPKLHGVLYTFGILDVEEVFPPEEGRLAYLKYSIHWNRLLKFFSNPPELFDEVYNWNGGKFKYKRFLNAIETLLSYTGIYSDQALPSETLRLLYYNESNRRSRAIKSLEIPFFLGGNSDWTVITQLGLIVYPIPEKSNGSSVDPVGFSLLPMIRGTVTPDMSNPESVISLGISGSLTVDGAFRVDIRPDEVEAVLDPSVTDLTGAISLRIKPPEPYILIGDAEGSHFGSNGFSTAIEAKGSVTDPEFTVGISFINKESAEKPGLFLVLNFGEGDGFLQKILGNKPQKFELGFDLKWSSKSGIQFNGQAGFEIRLPAHLTLGPISIENFYLAAKAVTSPAKVVASAGAGFSLKLGPLLVVIENTGLQLEIKELPAGESTGTFGDLDLDFAFKPPEGIGLSIDAGGLKGGGILDFDPDNHEYFGAMELEFKDMFSIKAFGIINTRMPDGGEGFSLLIIITAEFTPVQLGFGFTLMGVGGLLGLNRTVRLDVLKEGIKTNAIKSILFPEDVVANISRIVSDVKSIFPVQQDRFIICPMGKLGWGSPAIITLELGILVEIPVAGFAILGVLKAILPEEESALLKLQINFLGVADFDNRSFSLDGTLYDSRLLVYTLTGDMAFRLSYGAHPVFVLSVGGFHPAFKEAPPDLLHMQRLAISLFNSDTAWIKVETYFAVTSNTVQFGARAELFAGSTSGFNIYGFIGYDVLFQFDPFSFVADFSAGFALRRRSSVIMGITASGELAGPSPWDAHGKASVSFFFFSVSVSFHKTWGESITAPEPATADLTTMLKAELMDDRNWVAAIPPNNKLHVSIKQFSSDKTIVHPFGILTFSERLLPLNIDIEKFGNKRPKDNKRFAVGIPKTTPPTELTTEEVREPFAPASFFTLSDSEKLTRASYEEMISGFKITGSTAIQLPLPVSRPVDYELSYLGAKRTKLKRFGLYQFSKLSLKAGSKGGSSASSRLSVVHSRTSVNAPEKVKTQEERYVIASTSDMTLYQKNLVAKSYTEAMDHYKQIIKSDPALADQIQIVADYELNVN
jgi:hypothetical protein